MGSPSAVEIFEKELIDSITPPGGIVQIRSSGDGVSPEPLLAACRSAPGLLTVTASTTTLSLSMHGRGPGEATRVNLKWDDNCAATIELNDQSTLNAMTRELMRNLADSLSLAMAARTLRSFILCAAGPHFCTGGRYERNKLTQSRSNWWLQTRGICGSGHILDSIRAATVLSFSVLNGSSIGGGLMLGLAADLRLAT